MAINLPPNSPDCTPPIDGQRYTDPTTSKTWEYRSAVPGWVAINPATGGAGAPIYRGNIDLTLEPGAQYANIVAGNSFTITQGVDPVNEAWYPGLTGSQIALGQLIYTGSEYTRVSEVVPYATESSPGQIRIATQSEVTLGTSATSAVTPAYLKTELDEKWELPSGSQGQYLQYDNGNAAFADLPMGTTAQKGLTQFATESDVVAGVSDSLAVTPAAITNLLPEPATVPIGSVHWFVGTTPPTDYLECNGGFVDQATYSELWNLLGFTYGPANGSGDRRLPDLRGEFIRGWDHGRGVDVGRIFGSNQEADIAPHDHDSSIDDQMALRDPGGTNQQRPGNSSQIIQVKKDPVNLNPFEVKNTGTGIGDETRPRNVALLPCIKAK